MLTTFLQLRRDSGMATVWLRCLLGTRTPLVQAKGRADAPSGLRLARSYPQDTVPQLGSVQQFSLCEWVAW
jgi:hypothetical protein